MTGLKTFICIAASILIFQSSVNAVPLQQNRALVKRGSKLNGKFLHITDIHIDPNYKEGADPRSLCHTYGKKRSSESGKFGALGTDCDSPVPLVRATFDFLKNEINDIDFIIYTGDTVRHDRDDNLPRTQDEVLDGHKSVMKYFQSAYDTKYVPYVPTIGNNDVFDHNDVKINDKIFGHLETIWEPLGLNLTDEFNSGGYFVQQVIDDQLSIINLNSMYFFEKNNEASDCDKSDSPGAIQLKWLEKTLKSFSEKDGHQAYIMSHVPPIDDDGSKLYKSTCYKQYFNLLGKYSGVIAGHFTGHTNNDNLNVVVPGKKDNYDFIAAGGKKLNKKDVDSAGVALFNSPSIIPVNNPALRVYSYDVSGSDYPVGTIRDWEQYYVDLDKANNDGSVKFELEYTASKLYNVNHFDGKGVGQAVLNLADDKDARKLYKKYISVSV
ncbi:Metallo-dependent phosphatase-like protein [Gilbertella persicaria]|uniref:Endopolyphosphatase n=1 Tax=Rhizopus stolonifer TaxID=4846 RepID=A0A367JKQ6_RHIST|nr:Metallo-dependent phosphatase-like protein [Gilbertella persicaria]KAI8078979.1 Metallo-dependent phosphatase-like protein [Gilbertella persicaria]RCH90534.1 endopolyphosphatase [Rhizopus stolonifer]